LAIVVKKDDDLFAIEIDDVIQQQQVVVKGLGEEIKNRKGFMGSSILGNGMPALILDLFEIVSIARKHRPRARRRIDKEITGEVA
jgi:two-component system chemotaxis sensor kinase CheA